MFLRLGSPPPPLEKCCLVQSAASFRRRCDDAAAPFRPQIFVHHAHLRKRGATDTDVPSGLFPCSSSSDTSGSPFPSALQPAGVPARACCFLFEKGSLLPPRCRRFHLMMSPFLTVHCCTGLVCVFPLTKQDFQQDFNHFDTFSQSKQLNLGLSSYHRSQAGCYRHFSQAP